MNLGAATSPWGISSFMGTTSNVSSPNTNSISLTRSSIGLASPMGDGLSYSLDQEEVAAFDSLGAPFYYDTGNFVLAANPDNSRGHLNSLLRSIRHDNATLTQPSGPGHMGLAQGASRLTLDVPRGFTALALHREKTNSDTPLAGLSLSWQPEASPLTFSAGWLHEPNTMLGSSAQGAFGSFASDTAFLATELETKAGGWQFALGGELGVVAPGASGGLLVDGISPFVTSAFNASIGRTLPNRGLLQLALTQPLRVEGGVATFSLPSGRTQEGVVTGRTLDASLEPHGRHLDLALQYDHPVADVGTLSFSTVWSQEPNHAASAPSQWTYLAGWSFEF